ncbi:hypothetical protein XENOCAPTIV_013578 [Xenoophorus captivus]|uniref:Uncharacterized protein n=1 Tax=Xenoophorus captivus TaxID=1517983 RepID=A0ABV0RYK6_9TELE
MLRHCPIPRFSSSGARTKMPNAAPGKEKALHNPKESQTLDLADPKDIATKSIPPQKVLKIFSINIIAQGLPFCRRRVSAVRHQFGLKLDISHLRHLDISILTSRSLRKKSSSGLRATKRIPVMSVFPETGIWLQLSKKSV